VSAAGPHLQEEREDAARGVGGAVVGGHDGGEAQVPGVLLRRLHRRDGEARRVVVEDRHPLLGDGLEPPARAQAGDVVRDGLDYACGVARHARWRVRCGPRRVGRIMRPGCVLRSGLAVSHASRETARAARAQAGCAFGDRLGLPPDGPAGARHRDWHSRAATARCQCGRGRVRLQTASPAGDIIEPCPRIPLRPLPHAICGCAIPRPCSIGPVSLASTPRPARISLAFRVVVAGPVDAEPAAESGSELESRERVRISRVAHIHLRLVEVYTDSGPVQHLERPG
jgi:hypothetical protein